MALSTWHLLLTPPGTSGLQLSKVLTNNTVSNNAFSNNVLRWAGLSVTLSPWTEGILVLGRTRCFAIVASIGLRLRYFFY